MTAIPHDALSRRLEQFVPGARAESTVLPQAPEVSLYLLNADYPQHQLDSAEIARIMNYPAYWSFCWASGQVMARHLLQNPALVRGKTVADFGCGSGVAAIAAALAGATEVIACDNDPDALMASAANAELNGVAIDLCDDLAKLPEVDVLLVADVLYDLSNLPLLDVFLDKAAVVLLADSRIRNFAHPEYSRLGTWTSSTIPDLDESDEFSSVNLYLSQSEP